MKTKLTNLQRINRVIDFYYKRGVNSERCNRIKHKIIFGKLKLNS